MHTESGYSPVLVVVDRESTTDGQQAREWVERSAYNSCEAADVFEAIEEMLDVTMPYRPEVIVVGAECCEQEAEAAIHALDAIHLSDAPVQVVAVSENAIHTTGGGHYDVAPKDLPHQLEILISPSPDA